MTDLQKRFQNTFKVMCEHSDISELRGIVDDKRFEAFEKFLNALAVFYLRQGKDKIMSEDFHGATELMSKSDLCEDLLKFRYGISRVFAPNESVANKQENKP